MKISRKNKLIVLKETLKTVKKDRNPFVCVDCSIVLRSVGLDIPSSRIREVIPLLTFENAMFVCKKYKLKQPKMGCESGGWWEYGLKKPRIAFINWMISETENKSK